MTGLAIDRRLLGAEPCDSGAGLAAAWASLTLTLVLPGMAGFAAAPSLGNKLRGGLGAALLSGASPAVRDRRPCDWPATCAAELFFGRRPMLRLASFDSEIAKPFVLSAEARADGALLVKARLFGFACAYRHAFAEALVRAVTDLVRWHQLARDACLFVPSSIDIAAVSAQSDPTTPIESDAAALDLVFLSPLDAERGDPVREPALLLPRLLSRLILLAPWHGVSLAALAPILTASAEAIIVEVQDGADDPQALVGGQRFANRLRQAPSFRLSGDLKPLLPLLPLASLAHVGRGATLGLGRCRLTAGL